MFGGGGWGQRADSAVKNKYRITSGQVQFLAPTLDGSQPPVAPGLGNLVTLPSKGIGIYMFIPTMAMHTYPYFKNNIQKERERVCQFPPHRSRNRE